MRCPLGSLQEEFRIHRTISYLHIDIENRHLGHDLVYVDTAFGVDKRLTRAPRKSRSSVPKMSSLFALLSQQTPNLQTRKGLIVVGLQDDFISRDGKLPVKDTAFLDHISNLVPAFREHGQVIFVRSEFQQTRPVNGDDTPGDTVVAGGSLGADTEMASSSGASTNDNRYMVWPMAPTTKAQLIE